MLARFRKAKEAEIASLRQGVPAPWQGIRPDFSKAIQGEQIAVIAEYKRASPSRGVIREDISVEEAVRQYEAGGASAISILTEQQFFQGDMAFLQQAAQCTTLPLLRKDFIFDPLQIHATAAAPVSAVLLIVRFLVTAQLASLYALAKSYNIMPVVEIFDGKDLTVARSIGAEVIQVNSRDLSTLQTRRDAPLELARKSPPGQNEIWIAASAIDRPEHLEQAYNAGYSAVLVGTALMEAPLPQDALSGLLKNFRSSHA